MAIRFRAIQYFRHFLIPLGLLLVLGQNCSQVVEFASFETKSNQVETENGSSYGGKLTFIQVEAGFTCEGQSAPRRVLRMDTGKNWDLTENRSQKCAYIDRQPASDVSYDENTNSVHYLNLEWYSSAYTDLAPSSLAGLMTEFLVATGNPNTVDLTPGDGVCADSLGRCSLRASVDEANARPNTRTLIHIPPGTYNLTSPLMPFTNSTLIFRGTVASNLTSSGALLDGGGASTLMFARGGLDGNIAVENLVLQNSGAVFAVDIDGSFQMLNSIVRNDISGVHAGVTSRHVLIQKSQFLNNSGDGLNSFGPQSLVIEDSLFQNNGASGFYNGNGSNGIYIYNSSFVNNGYTGVYLRKCYSGCEIVNSTIFGNRGAGLYLITTGNYSDTIYVRNSTIVQNGSSTDSNITIDMPLVNPAVFYIQNSIIANPTAPRPNCFLSPSTRNLSIVALSSISDDSSCGNSGMIQNNPQLGPLANNGGSTPTLLPLPGSPAIDGGNNLVCTATDQRGWARPVNKLGLGATCDIGAVEVQ